MKRNILYIVCLCGMLCGQDLAAQKTVRIDKQLTIYNDVMRQLDMNYVDTLNYEKLTETAINRMLREVDPYTIYYPKQKDEELKMMTTGKYGGIGAIIQKKDDGVIIANPYEGKPAQRNGLQAGDRILEVDGWKTKGAEVSEVSNHLRGVPGTTIEIVLQREGDKKPYTVHFERESIHMDAVDYYALIDSVGYIAFGEFTEGSAIEFQKAAYDLLINQHARGLIVDLRGNGGGIIDEAIQILSNFLDKGTEVVSVRGKVPSSCRTYTTGQMPLFRDTRLAVLVDDHSASASEIVSGALQDLERATLIGQRTFGKGLVQNVRPIAHGGHLKVTTAKYYLPKGRCIQAIDYAERQRGNQLKKDTAGGILPDIVMTDSSKVDICYSLYNKNLFFDYATRYHRLHDSIASPQVYMPTDEDIEDFCQFLEEKKYTYETETGKYLKDLIKMAREEDLDSTAVSDLEAMMPRLTPSFREAIERNKDEVKQFLGSEIVQRYYYQKGKIAFLLRKDKVLRRAIDTINNKRLND